MFYVQWTIKIIACITKIYSSLEYMPTHSINIIFICICFFKKIFNIKYSITIININCETK